MEFKKRPVGTNLALLRKYDEYVSKMVDMLKIKEATILSLRRIVAVLSLVMIAEIVVIALLMGELAK